MNPYQRIPLTVDQERACLQFNPFQDDFGDQGDRVFTDTICTARSQAPCNDCAQPIQPGEQQRRHVGKYDGQMRTYRWCHLCCWAMAESWEDDGEAMEARFALRRESA